jgi:hypothetical protein
MKRLLLLLLLIPLASSLMTYSGDTTQINVTESYDYYSIIGNTTPINLNVTQIGNTIFITPDKYQSGDTFDLAFFKKEVETVTVYQGGGGGGSRTIYKDKNITKYVDNPIEIIKEVPTEVEKEVIKEVPVETMSLGVKIALIGAVISIILLGVYTISVLRRKEELENQLTERRLPDYE